MITWIELSDDNDLTHLLKRGRLDRYCVIAYQMLQDELIEYFGISEQYLKILRNKIKIELLKSEIIETGDRTRLIFVERLEQKNKELEAVQTKGDLYDAVFSIEKHMGFKFDVQKITVFEFYKYSKMLQKSLKTAS